MNAPLGARLFDHLSFADRLRAAVEARKVSDRKAAEAANVSPASFCRAAKGDPNLSHEIALRLEAWMQDKAA